MGGKIRKSAGQVRDGRYLPEKEITCPHSKAPRTGVAAAESPDLLSDPKADVGP